MANVPVSVPQLEEIAASVAQDVMEWLVVENDYADEQLPELALYATNITIMVINSFMTKINDSMGDS